MRRVIYFPIEEIPSRYGEGMNKVIMSRLTDNERGIAKALMPNVNAALTEGQFLDVVGTNVWKHSQMKVFLNSILPCITKNDVLLIHDIFYPGMESLGYVFDSRANKPRITAFNYAGRADPEDFVQQFGKWADYAESAWHSLCDTVFVGSEFHKRQVERKFKHKDVRVVGYPFDPLTLPCVGDCPVSTDYVAWPHRIAAEKNPLTLLSIARAVPSHVFRVLSGRPDPESAFTTLVKNLGEDRPIPSNIEFVHCEDKAAYYENLRACGTFLSTGYQETFGYALHEAIAYGSRILCANTACYSEFVPKSGLFDSVDKAEAILRAGTAPRLMRDAAVNKVHCGDDFMHDLRFGA